MKNNKINVLHVTSTLCGGGAERVILDLLKGMHNGNIASRLFISHFSGDYLSEVPFLANGDSCLIPEDET